VPPVTRARFEYAPAVIDPAPAHSLAALPTLPFAAQLRLIDRELDNGSASDALLRALAALRDHEPLAHAVVRAAQSGMLTAVAGAVAAVFTTLPDTGVQRVLRATISAEQRAIMPAEQRAVIVAAVRAAMETLPLARCAALCLMDRWLKNASPDTRAAVVAGAVAALEAALAPSAQDAQGGPGAPETHATQAAHDALDALPDEVLMRVPGQELARLAAAQPAGMRARLDARLSAFAGRVLDVLGAAPKSLSQANAEELLSRRVYTDPGHFLVELLQNAEDAGARAWRVDIGDHDVAVWHDGTPFDAKDVVGVLSIGQTTKHKEQIGFFGVGFKSVYEICERPQVYSGPFCFEIADVSIPRRLAGRPEGRPTGGTLLVLALRDPHDPERHPDRLYERALDVPPETLLTLRNIRELAASRGARSRTVHAEDAGSGISDSQSITGWQAGSDMGSQRPQRVDLVHAESGARTGYVTVRDRCGYDGGAREGSRASTTDVLVALRLDERGLPEPLPGGAATIYSYCRRASARGCASWSTRTSICPWTASDSTSTAATTAGCWSGPAACWPGPRTRSWPGTCPRRAIGSRERARSSTSCHGRTSCRIRPMSRWPARPGTRWQRCHACRARTARSWPRARPRWPMTRRSRRWAWMSSWTSSPAWISMAAGSGSWACCRRHGRVWPHTWAPGASIPRPWSRW
jgi:hypothetical protein